MRTNIVIDDDLMREAKLAAGTKTMRETVERGLRALVDQNKRLSTLELRGTVEWDGDLDEMRRGRQF